MAEADRLDNRDIALLLYIMQRVGLCGRLHLPPKRRTRVVPLWRRHLLEVWYRCAPDEGCMHGPYINLTVEGHRLAAALLAARDERRRARTSRHHPRPRLAA